MNRTVDAAAAMKIGRERAFHERVRRALSHDLRSPLGTIANYASILEYHGEPKPEEVQVFAGRIRTSALKAAAMLQIVSEALTLSRDAGRADMLEPAGVLRAILADLGLHAHFPARGREPIERFPIDRDLLAFTWKAFLTANAEASNGRVLDIDIEVASTNDEYVSTLWVGAIPLSASELLDAANFPGSAAEHGRPEACFALGFAEDLIRLHGGVFGLWGRAGEAAGLRIAWRRST